jgi:hypothetical protein
LGRFTALAFHSSRHNLVLRPDRSGHVKSIRENRKNELLGQVIERSYYAQDVSHSVVRREHHTGSHINFNRYFKLERDEGTCVHTADFRCCSFAIARYAAGDSARRTFGTEYLSTRSSLVPDVTRQRIERLARDAVAFANMLMGLRVDIKAMALGQMDNLTMPEKIGILERDFNIWNNMLALGQSLVSRLD